MQTRVREIIWLAIAMVVATCGCQRSDSPTPTDVAPLSVQDTVEHRLFWQGVSDGGSSEKSSQLSMEIPSDRRAVIFYKNGGVEVYSLGTLLPSGLLVVQEKNGIAVESDYNQPGHEVRGNAAHRAAASEKRWATVHGSGFVRFGELEPCRELMVVPFGTYRVEHDRGTSDDEAGSPAADSDWPATEFGTNVRLASQSAQFVDGDRSFVLLSLNDGNSDCERIDLEWQDEAKHSNPVRRTLPASPDEQLDAPGSVRGTLQRLWLLAPDGKTVVEVGRAGCAIWGESERARIVKFEPLPELSTAQISSDGKLLSIVWIETRDRDSITPYSPVKVVMISLSPGAAEPITLAGEIKTGFSNFNKVGVLFSPDQRFLIVNTNVSWPIVFDVGQRKPVELEVELVDERDGTRGIYPNGLPLASPSGKIVCFDSTGSYFSVGQFMVKTVEKQP